jgi:hypothetical protein
MAKQCRLLERTVVANVMTVLEALPTAVNHAAETSMGEGLDRAIIKLLRDRVQERVARCVAIMAHPKSASAGT